MKKQHTLLIGVLAIWLLPLQAASISDNYEKSECEGAGEPPGDITINCKGSPTIQKLSVELSGVKITGVTYEATAKIINTNNYPVQIKTMVATAKNSEREIVGFCSQSVNFILSASSIKEVPIKCDIMAMSYGVKDQKISSVEVKASPWE